jgi:hypothetical protein
MSPVKYELGFYIPEDGNLHSHCREHLTSYINHISSQTLMWVAVAVNTKVCYVISVSVINELFCMKQRCTIRGNLHCG